ncbi:Fcf2 pre-rRNA processing-domain-containing protein, partial [Mucidula mucida]
QSDSSSSSDSDSYVSDSDTDSEPITQEYLDSLLEKARQNAASSSSSSPPKDPLQEDIMKLDAVPTEELLPPLDPGILPLPYFELGEGKHARPKTFRDPDVELAEKASAEYSTPAPPIRPPELSKSGRALTKKEQKAVCALKKQTAGKDWFDMPAPSDADRPRLYREVEALRLHNQLDPKRFYRKDDGEGKGVSGLPKFFAMGTIVAEKTPFGGASSDNLTRANRKRTLVDELVEDAEAKRYAKRKFEDFQKVRGARGKNTAHAKERRVKW